MGKSNLRVLFDHFNKDKSGFIERNELKNMMRCLGKVDSDLQLDEDTIGEWVRIADLNGD